MAEILVQQIAQRPNRRHEEVRGASQHDEFFRYFERCPSIPVGIIWSGLIHESSAAFAVVSNDGSKPGVTGAPVSGRFLSVTKSGLFE